MFKKIFIPYDLSEPSKNAIKWAAHLKKKFESKITLFHAIPQITHFAASDIFPAQETTQQEVLQGIEQDIKDYFIDHEGAEMQGIDIKFGHGSVPEAILKQIAEEQPDIVIMGSHGYTGISKILMGSVAEKIVRQSPSMVMIVRGNPSLPLKKVVVPIDFSDHTEDALLLANEIRSLGEPKIDIVHSIAYPDIVHYPHHFTAYTKNNIEKSSEETAQNNLNKILEKHSSLSGKTQLLKEGTPAKEICKYAKENLADLIIIPTHGHTGFSHLFMGSVAESTVRYAPCSVLTFCPKHERDRRLKMINMF
ncbi:hypothetical protein BVY03_03520 [bacterium K02(2017)]|nr:hypothetical protein BVY03_03520 [bacterium K02(2017)]